MEKQFSTLTFDGVKVRVCGHKACYVNIGKHTVYLDDSTNEMIVDTWVTAIPWGPQISLNELKQEIQALRAENEILKAMQTKPENQ